MTSARGLWTKLRPSLWFIPTLCALLAAGLALTLAEVEKKKGRSVGRLRPST